jgi:hypothetical protein
MSEAFGATNGVSEGFTHGGTLQPHREAPERLHVLREMGRHVGDERSKVI